MYGHIQRNCSNSYRCMKCGEGHSKHLCEKPKTAPLKCANCCKLSIYLRCPKNTNNAINNRKRKKQTIRKKRRMFVTTEETKPKTTVKTDEEFHATLGAMLMDLKLHEAKNELKVMFAETTNKLIALYQESKKH